MDDSIAGAHALLSHLYILKREYDKAIAEGERAVALDPGGAYAHMCYADESEATQAGRKKPFHCSKKQSDSTPSVRPIFIHTSAMPSGYGAV